MRATKIVCTIGPACADPDTIRQMITAGMNVARLNFSHGTYESHKASLDIIQSISVELNQPVAMLVDLCGPRIRVGDLPNGPVALTVGETVTIVPTQTTDAPNTITCIYGAIVNDVTPGDRVLIDDGKIGLTVESVTPNAIVARVNYGAIVKSHKGMNLPGVEISAPSVTPKDYADIEWAIENKIDWVALSFVRHPDDIGLVRKALAEKSRITGVIAKIEKPEAVDHLKAIINSADGIMVARGDLGIEMAVHHVPLIQKRIITLCNQLDKPVITATQMLESMTDSPTPTRAEVSDVANAIIDGTDAVMLSGETAAGKYPVEAIKTMNAIAESAEPYCSSHENWSPRRRADAISAADAICGGARSIEDQLEVALIVAFTNTGSTALHMSKARPRSLILAPTMNRRTLHKMCLYYGVIPILIEKYEDSEQLFHRGQCIALEKGLVQVGDRVIFVAGVPLGHTGGTNMLRIHTVTDPQPDNDTTR